MTKKIKQLNFRFSNYKFSKKERKRYLKILRGDSPLAPPTEWWGLRRLKKEDMGKSSIHVRGASGGSEAHNNREKKLKYLNDKLTKENSFFNYQSIASLRAEISEKYQKSTGQKMQSTAVPIREGVLLISKEHTVDDLKRLARKIEDRFGIQTVQGYCHKDEGHEDKITGEWKPNYHAHMIFNWTHKETGKSVRMGREDMAELQTIVAEELGLERGERSTKKHIEATKYKALKEKDELKQVYGLKKTLPDALSIIETSQGLKKEIEPLKTAKNELNLEVMRLNQQREIENQRLLKEKTEKELEIEELKTIARNERDIILKNREIGKKDNELASRTRDLLKSEREKLEEIKSELNNLSNETDLARANLIYLEQEKVINQSKGLRR